MSVKIIAAADHRGRELIDFLKKNSALLPEIELEFSSERTNPKDDYTLVAQELVAQLLSQTSQADIANAEMNTDKKVYGLLICASGIGINIAANKFPGIVASLVDNPKDARLDRSEHNPNVLVISAEKLTTPGELIEIIRSWVKPAQSALRHIRRQKQLALSEKWQTSFPSNFRYVVPSPLTDQSADLESQVANFAKFAPIICIDILDNTLVEGHTVTLEQALEVIKNFPAQFFSLHLMTNLIEEKLPLLINLPNLVNVYVHIEALSPDIKNQDFPFALIPTINPNTAIEKILSDDYLSNSQQLQVMTVTPGAQGGELEESQLELIKTLRQKGFSGIIHVDGAVNLQNTSLFLQAGLNISVFHVGSTLSRATDAEATFKQLQEILN